MDSELLPALISPCGPCKCLRRPAAATGGPAFTMAGRISPGPASTTAALTPGPGAYPKAAAAVDATLPGQPAFTMGVRPSSPGGGAGGEGGGRTASPGPGQYDPADVDALSAPAWTMGAKLKPPGGMEGGVSFSEYQRGWRQYNRDHVPDCTDNACTAQFSPCC